MGKWKDKLDDLHTEISERFKDVDKRYKRHVEREQKTGKPIGTGLEEEHRELNECLDVLSSLDSELVVQSATGGADGEDDPDLPQREIPRESHRQR